ncbi:hypothetical protein H6F90_06040 [Trichocoleus sp. FACHB-591]|uniref:hypothetical protein n=1 Tax=Trichocoleus sp. FACHB-591 TaxID=2692872 RepID=UPI001684C319|nr:hypothetical protein [Trichocoleus sp. FACHB-591]MBD2094710.1 hypothetical protein [Trichocoleus sp. FACHB-591]
MKFSNLLGTTLLINLAGSYNHSVLASQQFDYSTGPSTDASVCYMRTTSGSTLNLDRLCGEKAVEIVQTKDQQFLEEYLGLLASSPTLNPQLRQVAQNNPRQILQAASDVCNALRTGTESTFWKNKTSVDRDILLNLSTEYYCRDLAD